MRTPPTNVRELLSLDEGRRRSVYQDHLGYWTIGAGRLVDGRRNAGLREHEIDFLLDNDIAAKSAELDAALPWWRALDPVRQGVILSMAFQMGTGGLLEFRTALAYTKARLWEQASMAMLKSDWAVQTPDRAHRLADSMRDGKWR